VKNVIMLRRLFYPAWFFTYKKCLQEITYKKLRPSINDDQLQFNISSIQRTTKSL